MDSILSPELETLLIFQAIIIIAALGHYLPLSINQLDIGIPGYMAAGAYTSAILTTRYATPFVVALLSGGAAACVLGLLVDSIAARAKAKGFAFAIISIGFFEVVQVVLTNWEWVGGSQGMSGIPAETNGVNVAVVLVVVIAFLLTLQGTYLGRAMGAIRDDERAAEAMGVNLLGTKLVVFGAGAFIGGLSGALYAHYALYIVPTNFSFDRLIAIQLPIIFGGLETFWGAIGGSAILGLLPDFVRPLAGYRLTVTAAITIAVILIKPNGLLSRHTVSMIGDMVGGAAAQVARRIRRGQKGRVPEVTTGTKL